MPCVQLKSGLEVGFVFMRSPGCVLMIEREWPELYNQPLRSRSEADMVDDRGRSQDPVQRQVEIERERVTTAFLQAQLNKLQEKEPAWERILKSSVTGVVIGAVLTLGANYLIELSRARDRARDIAVEQRRLAFQALDDLSALVYDIRTQNNLFTDAWARQRAAEAATFGVDVEGSYAKFSRDAPVVILKLRPRSSPAQFRAIREYFNSLVVADVEVLHTNVVRALQRMTAAPGDFAPSAETIQTMRDLHAGAAACSDAVIDFTYAVMADAGAVADEELAISERCRLNDEQWENIRGRAGRLPGASTASSP